MCCRVLLQRFASFDHASPQDFSELREQAAMVHEDAAASSERASTERAALQVAKNEIWPRITRDMQSAVSRETALRRKQRELNSAGPITVRRVAHAFCHAVRLQIFS